MEIGQIQKRIEMIEKLQREVRDSKEILKGELENDQNYVEAFEEAKEAANKKKRIKQEIENQGSNKQMLVDIKENTEELGTLKEILSAELIEYYSTNKSDEITDANGEIRKFKFSVKLQNRRSGFDD